MDTSDTGHVDGAPLLLQVGVGVIGQLHRPGVKGISLGEDKPSLLPCLQERGRKRRVHQMSSYAKCVHNAFPHNTPT